MKSLVIYDSAYGNTKKVADAIAQTLGTTALLVADVDAAALRTANLVVVGSPTQGGRSTVAVQNFLKTLPPTQLSNIPVAAFDTRFGINEHGFFLRTLMRTIGFAAPRIAKTLELKGGKLIVEPQGFIVQDKDGPLKQGELERASNWAKMISRSV